MIQQSKSLRYELSSEPLHISAMSADPHAVTQALFLFRHSTWLTTVKPAAVVYTNRRTDTGDAQPLTPKGNPAQALFRRAMSRTALGDLSSVAS